MNIGIRLKRLNDEDLIWLVYFFIIIGAVISNRYEKRFLLNGDIESQKKVKILNITVLSVAFFIYVYFVAINYESVDLLRQDSTKKEVINAHVSLIASLLFLVAGGLTLWAELDRDLEATDAVGFT